MLNARTLFIASCLALITSAFTFSIRGNILPDLEREYGLSHTASGQIAGGAFLGMCIALLVGSSLCDALGMKNVLFLAFGCHVGGTAATIFTPQGEFAEQMLYWATFIVGCGNGLVEVAINPLAATIYPKQKVHYLNVLHAWWPGGLILGGLSCLLVGNGIELWAQTGENVKEIAGAGLNWQAQMSLIFLPAIGYLLLILPQKFPQTERVAAGVSTGAMFAEALRPMFLLWLFCMLLTAATELGPQQWQETVMMQTTEGKVSGTLILVYTSTLMFILRHFAGPLAHRLSPVGLLIFSSVFSAIGLYLLSFATNAAQAFGFATIFGIGIAYYWSTMLGVTAERFPKGGAFLLGLMGAAGNLSVSLVLPFMGYTYDRSTVAQVPPSLVSQVVVEDKAPWPLPWVGIRTIQKVSDQVEGLTEQQDAEVAQAKRQGAAMAFRVVSILPVLLVIIFTGIVIRDRRAGGYRAEMLHEP